MGSPRQFFLGLVLCLCIAAPSGPVEAGAKVLFDASHRENAGNADWVIDADSFDLMQPHYPCGGSDFENESHAQRFPTPAAAGVNAATPETYWTGGISAFAVDLVKLGYEVESLPIEGAITFGDGGNPQDLSGYDVLVLPEPNQPFTLDETTAIRDFVAAGGGLFLITDHQTSDRDCDGHDSPHIGNDLMGVTISGGSITDFGLFGIAFNVEEIAGQNSADYWFTDGVDDNVSTDPTDPIIHGPHGDGSGGLGFFGATSMTIDPAGNASVRGHVWKTDAGGQGNTRVTFATATYLAGRIACIGDSSPADDGTWDPGDTLFLGWDRAAGGVNNKEIHLNAVAWLAGPDTTPPSITAGPTVSAFDCSAAVAWTTDEAADGTVEFGPTTSYGSSVADPSLTTSHLLHLPGLLPGAPYDYQVGSTDSAGNGPTLSADGTFSTTAAAAPLILSGPAATEVTGTTATIVWTTDEPSDSRVLYGETPGYGETEYDPAQTPAHAVALGGLNPSTTYHLQVESVDGCGNGPTVGTAIEFTTAPAQIDLSGWTLLQFNSSQSYVFPPGTAIPGGGYLVLGRDASQSAFEAEWGPLPAGTVYVTSGATFPFINGDETYELRDPGSAPVDGVTVAIASGTSIQRINPGDPPGDPASWTVVAAAAGSPGSGAGSSSAAGVVINEASDASDYHNEFIELYYDADVHGPDTVPPEATNDLSAEPRSDTVIRLTWTAPGDDGGSGTAHAYDVRHAPHPILGDAGFAAATPLAGEPTPAAAGNTETWEVTGLDPSTSYYFALRTRDEANNSSPTSNTAGGTTGPPGSGGGSPTADHVVLSEIQTRGPVSHDDEFIEIHNPTGSPVDLTGWSLQYKSASGTSYLVAPLPAQSIAPGGYFLAARSGGYAGGVAPDALFSDFAMSASGGHVFLVSSGNALASCTGAGIVDKIGYGSADCPETAAAPAHAAAESLERGPGSAEPLCGNGTDSDDNASDIAVLGLAEPQNSLDGEFPCGDLGNVGASLHLGEPGRDDLRWAGALGAASYKVRRATARDFMQTHPVPDDTHLLDQTSAVAYTDPGSPAAGTVFYYFVNAGDGGAGESAD